MGLGQFDLVNVPMTGMPEARSALVWRRRARDPKLREFIRQDSNLRPSVP
jgi:hypothetical protein